MNEAEKALQADYDLWMTGEDSEDGSYEHYSAGWHAGAKWGHRQAIALAAEMQRAVNAAEKLAKTAERELNQDERTLPRN